MRNLLVAAALGLVGCMATVPAYPVRPWDDTTIARVQVGMTPEELVQVYGPPDTTYSMTFGKAVGAEWQGVAYRYYAVRDPLYRFSTEWRKNVFYFHRAADGSLHLNHWMLEHQTTVATP